MNANAEWMKQLKYIRHLRFNERILKMEFGTLETLYSFDTYQFEDYSKVVADRFDPVKKAQQHREVFPEECKKAWDMGVRFGPKKGIKKV